MAYKFHTAAEYHQMILDAEREVEEQSRLEQVKQWMANPANAAQLQHIRQELDRVAPRPQPRPTAQPAPRPAGTLPAVINGDARFHPSHLKLKPATSQVDSVTDPYEPGRAKRI